jgi:hypothetical protein
MVQYAGQPLGDPMTLQNSPAQDGEFIFYEDDRRSLNYCGDPGIRICFTWNDTNRILVIEPDQE